MNNYESILSAVETAEVITGEEKDRLRVLQDLDLLDTPESEGFDRITRMARRLFDTPISAVSLTDGTRQWFKSYIGTNGREIPRLGAPCAEVTRSKHLLVIPDLLEHDQFDNCLLAQSGIRFYAGAPLTTRDGYVLGAMCVLDKEPRNVNADEISALQDFASMVIAQIELQHDFGRVEFLSGFPNRNQLAEDLDDLQRRYPDTPRVLVLIDLGAPHRLDEVVRVLGTVCLDSLVKAASRIIKDIFGRKTGVYHVGTAPFAVLLDETAGESWRELVDRLAESLKEPFDCNSVPLSINPAFGISPLGLSDSWQKDALRTAVSAAHDAREAQIDWAVYSLASDEANQRRYTLLTEMKEALNQPDHLSLSYQPRLDLNTQKFGSAEALLRWRHPRLGNVLPGEFIPLIEQTTLVLLVTQWVIKTAFRQLSVWQKAGLVMQVSINISALDFETPDFTQSVAEALTVYGVTPSCVELEFTESTLIRNRQCVLRQLEEIRSMGVGLAIDDFGTGYSTFSYLQKLPATTIKLDRSLIAALAESTRDRTLVRSVITMAHDLGYCVVAEGVETQDVYDILEESKCDQIQGYFISRPLPATSFPYWVLENGGCPNRCPII